MPMRKNQITRICPGCKKGFSYKASRKQIYCSMACRTNHKRIIVKCQQCGKEIKTYRSDPQKYCSISCEITARNLTDQNPSYHRDIRGEKNPMFGKRRFGPDNPMFGKFKKNLRKIRKDGYVLVKAPVNHPYPCDTSSGTAYILEHRLIMEKHIKRHLKPTEIVHHVDGNPGNNEISNLKLFINQSNHISIGHS